MERFAQEGKVAMRIIFPGDNRYVGAVAAAGHPAFPHLVYVAFRRDERDSKNFRKVRIVEYNRQTDSYREIKKYENGEPMGPAAIACLGDGSLYVGLCWGLDDGSVVFADDIIPDACPPFTAAGAWTTTQFAVDADARRIAGDATKNASAALSRTQAIDKKLDATFTDLRAKVTKDVLASLGGSGLKLDDPALLKLIWDKAGDRIYAEINPADGNNSSLEHRIWDIGGDRIYAEATNESSPLSNVVVQRIKAVLKALKIIY